MITPVMFYAFAVIAFLLGAYTFLDNNNRVFGHIITSVTSMILFFMLGVNLMGGTVGDSYPVSINETVNNSTTTLEYSTITVPMVDNGISWFFIMCGVGMLVISLMAALEVIREARSGGGQEPSGDWYE
jgi:hypothetical protein